jgi:AraC-like DNA-binding protein
MKPLLEKLSQPINGSFVLQKDVYPYYPTPWHYHPEFELVLVVKSRGRRIIGDSMEEFSDGDLAFIGPNLPHAYRNHEIYYEGRKELTAEAIVIHFKREFLGDAFLSLPEINNIHKLFQQSVYGMQITGTLRSSIANRMEAMLSMRPTRRLFSLLEMLDELSVSCEYRLLASAGFIQNLQTGGKERLPQVYEFLMKHFKEEVKLEDVAARANMTPQAFCRFFKARTRKTFTEFINELRIGFACKLLEEDQHNISEICFASGYNNLSNFNRQFLRLKGTSPGKYRKSRLQGRQLDIGKY